MFLQKSLIIFETFNVLMPLTNINPSRNQDGHLFLILGIFAFPIVNLVRYNLK